MVAGLEDISGGTISIGERVVNDLEPAERDIAMVFQNYALYPHMSVFDNMAYGLKIAKVPMDEIKARVDKAANILELGHLLQRKPRELSGGQRQRVAIGRAIVRQPKVFLFDEPLSNLDAALRVNMRIELARLHKELGTTMIYVTHDQVEAMTLGNRIAVFNQGRIEQVGAPLELYNRPASPFVVEFLGQANKLPAQITAGRADVLGWQLPAPARADGAGVAYVRPSDWSLSHHAVDGSQSVILRDIRAVGPRWQLDLAHGDRLLEIELSSRDGFGLDGGDADLTPGHELWLHPRKAHLFPAQK